MKETILRVLEEEFPYVTRTLNSTNDFTFLIALVLSANTTDNQVNKSTEKLFEKIKTPEDVLSMPFPELEDLIKSTGMWRKKAQFIKQIACRIAEKGMIPKTRKELENLPGIGHKISAVFFSQARGENHFAVDTHCQRALSRWGITTTKDRAKTEKLATKYFMEKLSDLHLRIIAYARKFCKPGIVCKCRICGAIPRS